MLGSLFVFLSFLSLKWYRACLVAILIVGGHRAMYDLAKNAELHSLIKAVYGSGHLVAAVCHGRLYCFGSMKH